MKETQWAKNNVTSWFVKLRYEGKLWFMKPHGGSYSTTSGIPDYVICIKGRAVYIETKILKGKLTEKQKLVQSQIRKAGGLVFNVTPRNWLMTQKDITTFIGSTYT